jgi:hypothetical protein
MSEYQYYEFVAIDEPLTPKQMAELRSRSSRASITSTSFINVYQWGDLKGDPIDWMRRYFDSTRSDFDRKLVQFMARHAKRGALVQRLADAGLWKKSSR